MAEDGVNILEWRIDPETGSLNLADLEVLLQQDVALVCFPHCSNVVGEINDVAAITAKAKSAGARVCVDGVSYAPHGFPDVGELGCDVYLFSAYKTYGPHQGIMVIRKDWGLSCPIRVTISTAMIYTNGSRLRALIMRRSLHPLAWPIIWKRCLPIMGAGWPRTPAVQRMI